MYCRVDINSLLLLLCTGTGHHACLWLALPDPTMNVLTYHYVLLYGHNQRSIRFNKMLMKIIYRIVWGLSCKYRPMSDIKYHNYLSDNCSVRSAKLAMLIVDVGLRALDQGRSKLPYHSFGMVTSKWQWNQFVFAARKTFVVCNMYPLGNLVGVTFVLPCRDKYTHLFASCHGVIMVSIQPRIRNWSGPLSTHARRGQYKYKQW